MVLPKGFILIAVVGGLLGVLAFFNPWNLVGFVQDGALGTAEYFLSGGEALRLYSRKTVSQEEAVRIVEENERLLAKNFAFEELKSENVLLKRALGLKDANKLPVDGMRVVYYGMELGHEYLLVDGGLAEGVTAGSAAIDSYGFLVGFVREVTPGYTRIAVASNPGETMEIEVLPLGTRALAKGMGGRSFLLELLPADAPVDTGDYVRFLGGEGMRQSFFLGTVLDIKSRGGEVFKEARAILGSKPDYLKEVFLVEGDKNLKKTSP